MCGGGGLSPGCRSLRAPSGLSPGGGGLLAGGGGGGGHAARAVAAGGEGPAPALAQHLTCHCQLLHQLLTYQLLPAVSSHSCSWSRSPRPGTWCRWRSGHWSQAGSHWSLVSGHSCGSRGGGGGRLGLASRSLASLPRYTGHMGPGLGRWRSNISVRGDGVCMFVTLARDRRMRRTATWHQRWHRYHCPARTGHWGRNLCLDTHPR